MLLTKYITLDEFKQYFNDVDLKKELGSEESALAFLKRIEDRMSVFIDSNFAKNIDAMYPNFTDYQKEHYKLALLEQAIYVFRNGDILVDSGFDTEKGKIISRGDINGIAIAPYSIDNLRVCGLWNRNIRSTNGYGLMWWLQ